ncbi:MAG: hypothetical protein HRT66_03610 [Flavobacteriaceae bacterium]|nr:hypothetical protein [Flavobacteriaceae bacterium]
MKESIKLILILITLSSCETAPKLAFNKVDLNRSTKDIIDIYIEEIDILNNKKHGLRLGVHHYDDSHYMLFVSNYKTIDDVPYEEYLDNLSMCFYKGYKLYVYDKKNVVSNKTKDKISVKYDVNKTFPDISLFDGIIGVWEIHFRDGNLSEIYLKDVQNKEETKNKIKGIKF